MHVSHRDSTAPVTHCRRGTLGTQLCTSGDVCAVAIDIVPRNGITPAPFDNHLALRTMAVG